MTQFITNPAQRLKLARPPFKPVGHGGARRGLGVFANRLSYFAAALRTRYDGQPGNARPQALIYRQNSLGWLVQRLYSHTQSWLHPRLQLTFQTGLQKNFQMVQTARTILFSHQTINPAPLPNPSLHPAAIYIWKGHPWSEETGLHPLEIQRMARETSRLALHLPTHFIQYLSARGERQNTVRSFTAGATHEGKPNRSASSAFYQTSPQAQPVPRVPLTRVQTARRQDGQPAVTVPPPAGHKPFLASSFAESSRPIQPEMSIHQLADQVVQVINDRVTARQERTGRI